MHTFPGLSKGISAPISQCPDQAPKKSQSTNQAETSHKTMLQQDGQEQLAHPKLSVPPANSSIGNASVSVLLASPDVFTKPKAAFKVLLQF